MNTYSDFVNTNLHRLRGFEKIASDLATMLDHPLFQVTGESGYARQSSAEIRERIFNLYCTVMARLNVPLPQLEPDLYLAHLNEKVDEKDQKRLGQISDHVGRQLSDKKTKNTKECRAIMAVMHMFPGVMGWSGINSKNLIAQLNKLLVEAGKDPIRPSYAGLELKCAQEMEAPLDAATLLIVDDDQKEIAKTMMAVAGWVNVSTTAYLHQRESNNREERLSALADKIIALAPDVVLMDQGLDNAFEGSDLIRAIKAKECEKGVVKGIIFVANTGGSDTELRQEGAYGNCNKGQNLRSLEQAFLSIEKET